MCDLTALKGNSLALLTFIDKKAGKSREQPKPK